LAGLPVSFADAGVLAGRLIQSVPILGGLACYAVSVVVWILALSRVPVSVAYPMLSIGYVVNLLAARVLFAEQITLQRVAGVGVIVAGCWLVARS
jgi:multidrug transporter EmrE-like cation transporter